MDVSHSNIGAVALFSQATIEPVGTQPSKNWLGTTASQPKLPVISGIVLLHGLLIFALISGHFDQAKPKAAQEVFATLILDQAAAQLTEQPAHPKKPLVESTIKTEKVSVSPVSVETIDEALEQVKSLAPTTDTPIHESIVPFDPPVIDSIPKTISTGVEYIRAPAPIYPPKSRRLHEQGKAILRVVVNVRGLPESVEIDQSSGFDRLDEAARLAVLRALFKPFIENGVPKAVVAMVPIRFQLDS